MNILVTDLATGRRVASGWFERLHHVWPTISRTVAEWYEADPEDVSIEETDDGDMVSVNGRIVASMADGSL